jgi:hypothetical protein
LTTNVIFDWPAGKVLTTIIIFDWPAGKVLTTIIIFDWPAEKVLATTVIFERPAEKVLATMVIFGRPAGKILVTLVILVASRKSLGNTGHFWLASRKIRQKQQLFLIGQQKNSWQAAGLTWISYRSGKKIIWCRMSRWEQEIC